MRLSSVGLKAGLIAGIVVFCIGLFFFSAWIIMLLWNWLAPTVWESAPLLSYWQIVAVCILLSILGSFFKGSK